MDITANVQLQPGEYRSRRGCIDKRDKIVELELRILWNGKGVSALGRRNAIVDSAYETDPGRSACSTSIDVVTRLVNADCVLVWDRAPAAGHRESSDSTSGRPISLRV